MSVTIVIDSRHDEDRQLQRNLFALAPDDLAVESFRYDSTKREIVRSVRTGARGIVDSRLRHPRLPDHDLSRAYDEAWLHAKSAPAGQGTRRVRVADIFSGCGLMTLGVAEACRAIGYRCDPVFAMDFDPIAADTYAANFPNAVVLPVPVETYLDRGVGAPPSVAEAELMSEVRHIDILVGGPPCQGNSDLNNHTRRQDSRNALFIKMARFAELVRPDHIIVENVRGILHDRDGIYSETHSALSRLGYCVAGRLLDASHFGVAQRRRRFFMIASRRRAISIDDMVAPYRTRPRTFGWACGDLRSAAEKTVFDSAPIPSRANSERIRYLFREDVHDLPDHQRPDCHRLRDHTYRSVYGRLRWDEPAQTVTTGFGSMGQGRYIHPLLPRTITPHEAARLQFTPDFFRFETDKRTALAQMIGNGVPPKLIYILALELLR